MRAIPLLAAASLAIVGCSSGDDDADSTTTVGSADSVDTTVPPTDPPATDPPAPTQPPASDPPETTQPPVTDPPPTTAPPAPSTAPQPSTTIRPPIEPDDPFFADKQLALAALLTVDDFGAGWEVGPPPEDREETELDEALDLCLDPDDPDGGNILEGRNVASGEFTPSGNTFPQINQEVGLADDEQMAIAAMDRIAPERALPCYRSLIGAVLEEAFAQGDDPDAPEVEVGDVAVDVIDLQLPLDVGVAYRMVVDLAVGTDEITLVLDIRFLRQGRALSQLQFEGFGEPVTLEGQDTITNVVLERLAAIGNPIEV